MLARLGTRAKALQCRHQYKRMAVDGCSSQATQHIRHVPGGHIAYRLVLPQQQHAVDVVFLHGLLSNMSGAKARTLEQHAQQHGHGFVCFDARGHGSSSGTFEGTHLGDWHSDALQALELAPAPRHILVGSSFGGWQALHIAVERPEQVAGLVLIAPALDFTSRLWKSYTPEQQQHYQQQGEAPVGSRYLDGGQVMVNIEFFRKAESFLVLDRLHELNVQCPLRILHGVKDDVVPVSIAQQLFEQLPANDVVLSLVKDGGHRMSRLQDLKMLQSTVEDLLIQVS